MAKGSSLGKKGGCENPEEDGHGQIACYGRARRRYHSYFLVVLMSKPTEPRLQPSASHWFAATTSGLPSPFRLPTATAVA
jgi:hypothetical protein